MALSRANNYFVVVFLFFRVVRVIMLKFVLLVNKQGQTRLSQYYEYSTVEERVIMEADIIRKCLARSDEQVLKNHELTTDTRN